MAKNKRPRKAYTPKRVSSDFVKKMMPLWPECRNLIAFPIECSYNALRRREGDFHQEAAAIAARFECAAVMARRFREDDGEEKAAELMEAVAALQRILTALVHNEETDEEDWAKVNDAIDTTALIERPLPRYKLKAAYNYVAQKYERIRHEENRIKQMESEQ